MAQDILFKTDSLIFSYRVAGILIRDGKILLQKPKDDDGYALPGGHVGFGETSEEALIREYREEIHAEIKTERLMAVGEIFFPWGKKPCQQISLYYLISLCGDSQILTDGTFKAFDESGKEREDLDFYWVPLAQLEKILLYPENLKAAILSPPRDVEYFVCKQDS